MVILDRLYTAMPDWFFLAPETIVLLSTSAGRGFLRNAKSDFFDLPSVGSSLTAISGKERPFFFSGKMSKRYFDHLK